jgi:SAM-dependent methyltransferase
MPVNRCRVCGERFGGPPLLAYRGMPKAAQYLPDRAALPRERGVDLDIRQCRACGLVQLRNDPVPYHREVVRAAAFSPEMAVFRRRQLGAFVRAHRLRGRPALEVGCGRGEYLALLRDAGLDAVGLEYGREAARDAARRGLPVVRGYLGGRPARLRGAPFAAFFIFNFLEHLPDPNASLRALRAHLREDTVGLVEVPNLDMVLRERQFAEFIGDHLLYFTRDTLVSTLQRNGFEVAACPEIWHDYILSAQVRVRRPLDLAGFRASRAALQHDVDAYLARFPHRSVAVWGAGHQALAVLALLRLGSRIRYVVDSAPFKQGRFTPATHIPIVAPDTLDRDPVEAVIVMAASYTDEVVRTIRRRYKRVRRVARLQGPRLLASGGT